jgi:hypothetical protein
MKSFLLANHDYAAFALPRLRQKSRAAASTQMAAQPCGCAAIGHRRVLTVFA